MRRRSRHPYRRNPCLTRSTPVRNSPTPSISLDITRSSASTRQFLYPSEEDLYKLVRFLVGKLSEFSGARTPPENSRNCSAKEKLRGTGKTEQNEEILNGLNDMRLKTQAFESSYRMSQGELAERSAEPNSVLCNVEIMFEDSNIPEQDFSSIGCSKGDDSSYLSKGFEGLRKNGSEDQDSYQGEKLKKPMEVKHLNFQHLDEELQLLKTASEMVFDDQHAVEFHIERLNDQLEAKRHKLKELESEWDSVKKPLQKKKGSLEQALLSLCPEASGKVMRMKEIELEAESISAEIKKREEELSRLSSDLEKQTKMAPRRSYIERVNEITKNSRKQDNDIQQILKDTRELQLESNTIQERLNRTYAIVDETIFREGKKDYVARQAYRLLTNIHESFEQITEKILATDRTRRDTADYEAKLVNINSRGLDIGKLQADLDTIRKENEFLEQRLF
ncbi:hypothetical protein ACS0TY_033297 [Phlomoides rotata]